MATVMQEDPNKTEMPIFVQRATGKGPHFFLSCRTHQLQRCHFSQLFYYYEWNIIPSAHGC